jgi:3-mercaptopyruvate sulfurtransferase SseA
VKTTVMVVLSLLLAGFVSPVLGLERFEIVTTQELKEMLKERTAGRQNFVLVNTLDTLIYEHHFIPGSINIPWSRIEELADRLGPDRNRLVITYCMGYR